MGRLHSPSPALTCDLHLDCPWVATKHGPFDLHKGRPESMVNLSRLKRGRLDVMVFALYLPDSLQNKLGSDRSHQLIDQQIAWINQLGFDNILMGLEGGRLLDNSLVRLEQLSILGVKYLTITHNFNTSWADSATDSPYHKGLAPFGVCVVEKANDLGIVLDVSHASDMTCEAVLGCSTRPVIASHSGCRSLVDHPRNLSDGLICRIAKSGGVIGIPFVHNFLQRYKVIDHINHAAQLVGPKHVAIGSDLDGARMTGDVKDVGDWGTVVMDALADRGYSDADIAAIAGGNALKLLEEHTDEE